MRRSRDLPAVIAFRLLTGVPPLMDADKRRLNIKLQCRYAETTPRGTIRCALGLPADVCVVSPIRCGSGCPLCAIHGYHCRASVSCLLDKGG